MDDSLRQKKRVFDIFDALDDSGDDEQDLGRKASERLLKKASKPTPSVGRMRADLRSLARSKSDSTLDVEKGSPVRPDYVVPSSTDPRATKSKPPLQLRKTVSDIPSKVSVSSRLLGKRKRESFIKTVPEDQQVFQGLHFYFFPNDDKNPPRRMRIEKAREFGAVWHKDWNPSITHVIMDRNMDLDSLLRWNKLDQLPPTIIVVSENYPSECLAYRTLLDPTHFRFGVKGYTPKSAPAIALAKTDSADSNKSLILKSAGRDVMSRRPETPPREQEAKRDAQASTRADIATEMHTFSDRRKSELSLPQPEIVSSKELDEAIARAKALEHISLDDEADNRPNSADGPESDGEQGETGLNLSAQRGTKRKRLREEEKWQCMQKNTGDKSGNPNEATIDILQQMADHYGQTGDEWRIRAYRKAIATLRNHPTKVSTKEEAGALPNVGPRLAEKIEEIAFTSRLRRLENAKAEPADQVLQTFMQVYGAGIKTASEWVDQGYTTLDELLEKANLTENQRVGIAHYEDFNSRIPRAEVERHGDFVREKLRRIDSTFEVIIGGSFRRGAEDSGDIDCIITRPDTGAEYIRDVVLGKLVPQLTAEGFLVATLAITSRDDGSKWHGASCLPGAKIWRRLDFLLVPSDEIGAALIYFTGNDIFNRSLRLLASTKGMRLNQRGLYRDVMRGKGRVKLTEGTLVESRDEKKIFEALGVPWRPPEHRIC